MAIGWNTTDENEIDFRKKRAQKEQFEITNLDKRKGEFATYEVKSKGRGYTVELRSIDENINSCSCPDFEVNRLGTCKHIEALKLLYEDKKIEKNRKIEIFLDRRVDKIVIKYPKRSRKNQKRSR